MKQRILAAVTALSTVIFSLTAREYCKSEHMIAMRDGTRLYTAVYRPSDMAEDEKSPILYMRTPYGCRPYGTEMSGFLNDSIYRPYADAGYIFVFQDVRGRWMSEGEFVNVRPLRDSADGIDEATDSYDTVEWLIDSVGGNNGRVGVNGNSYCGFYALMAAASGHPAIKAVSPQAPIGDWWMGDDLHHNGALALIDATSFSPQLRGCADHRPTDRGDGYKAPMGKDVGEWAMNNTVADVTRSLDGNVPFWLEMTSHPDYDDWWSKRSSVNATHGITAPMLVVGGHFDAEDLYGTLAVFRGLKSNSRAPETHLVMGPWAHGAWRSSGKANRLGEASFGDEPLSRYFRDEVEFPFFERYLRERGDGGVAAGSDVIFFTGENRWHHTDIARRDSTAAPLDIYLTESGLSLTPPTAAASSTVYISDPGNPVPYYGDITTRRKKEYMTASQVFVDGRDDVVTFILPAMADTLSVAGPVDAELFASISTTDADFIVKVIDVAPDGKEMLVRGDIMRGRYRNSFSHPEAFTPGKIEKISFTMPDIAHTFLPGHSLKIQVQSSWFPLFDRNPQQMTDIYNCRAEDFVKSEISIYHDAAHPSRIRFRQYAR